MSDAALNSKPRATRIESIDALRGITILVMLFVNDLASVTGAPAWMKHFHPTNSDGMTFVDVVFPAFLFIVGISIPFAIGKRLTQRPDLGDTWKHILIRTFGLLVIGVFMVNTYYMSNRGLLNPKIWTLLMYAAVILIWNSPPREPGPRRTRALRLRYAGILLLLVLPFFYSGKGNPGLMEMRPHWWGILGLIGWAYLLGCAAYIPFRRAGTGSFSLLGIMALLYCFFMAFSAGTFPFLETLRPTLHVGSMFAVHTAIVISGIILGMMLTPDSPLISHASRIRFGLLYCLGMAAAALMLHSLSHVHKAFIYSKNEATPAWALMCSAITALIWVAVYWLMDVKGLKKWAKAVEPAGTNAMFAYILAPMFYALFELIGEISKTNFYFGLGDGFSIGFWRSLIFAFAVTWLAGGLRRLGIWLKL